MDTTLFQFLHATLIGLGLAASCGFRVFVPMLVMGIAVRAGQIELSQGWGWLGSWAALAAFFIASVIEVGAYYIPWVDNALDAIQSPAAVIAGIVATAACVSEMSPLVQWSTAIIAGGGVAALVSGGNGPGQGNIDGDNWGSGELAGLHGRAGHGLRDVRPGSSPADFGRAPVPGHLGVRDSTGFEGQSQEEDDGRERRSRGGD